jgi:hypothetical protein
MNLAGTPESAMHLEPDQAIVWQPEEPLEASFAAACGGSHVNRADSATLLHQGAATPKTTDISVIPATASETQATSFVVIVVNKVGIVVIVGRKAYVQQCTGESVSSNSGLTRAAYNSLIVPHIERKTTVSLFPILDKSPRERSVQMTVMKQFQKVKELVAGVGEKNCDNS